MKISFLQTLLKQYDNQHKTLFKNPFKTTNQNLTDLRQFLKDFVSTSADREFEVHELYVLWLIVIRARPLVYVTETQLPFSSPLYPLFSTIHEALSRSFPSVEAGMCDAPMWLASVGLFTADNFKALHQARGNDLTVVDCLVQAKILHKDAPSSQRHFGAAIGLTNLAIQLLWTLLCVKPSSLLTQTVFNRICELDREQPFELYRSILQLKDGDNLTPETLQHFLTEARYVGMIARNHFVFELQQMGYKVRLGEVPQPNVAPQHDELYLYLRDDKVHYAVKGSGFLSQEERELTADLGDHAATIAHDITRCALRPGSRQVLFAALLKHHHRLYTGINPMVFYNIYLLLPTVVKNALVPYVKNLAGRQRLSAAAWIEKLDTKSLSAAFYEVGEPLKDFIDPVINEMIPSLQWIADLDRQPVEWQSHLRDLIYLIVDNVDRKSLFAAEVKAPAPVEAKAVQPAKAGSWTLPDMQVVRGFSNLFTSMADTVSTQVTALGKMLPAIKLPEFKR